MAYICYFVVIRRFDGEQFSNFILHDPERVEHAREVR
jgi:hypothetical protein